MKTALLLLLTLSIPKITPPAPPRQIVDKTLPAHAKGGRWYMAEDGHAIFCYGPTMLITSPTGGFTKVATFCRGDKTIVPLHE